MARPADVWSPGEEFKKRSATAYDQTLDLPETSGGFSLEALQQKNPFGKKKKVKEATIRGQVKSINDENAEALRAAGAIK